MERINLPGRTAGRLRSRGNGQSNWETQAQGLITLGGRFTFLQVTCVLQGTGSCLTRVSPALSSAASWTWLLV